VHINELVDIYYINFIVLFPCFRFLTMCVVMRCWPIYITSGAIKVYFICCNKRTFRANDLCLFYCVDLWMIGKEINLLALYTLYWSLIIKTGLRLHSIQCFGGITSLQLDATQRQRIVAIFCEFRRLPWSDLFGRIGERQIWPELQSNRLMEWSSHQCGTQWKTLFTTADTVLGGCC